MSEEFSVLVIAHGRPAHLQRLLDGVNRSSRRPTEVVVVYMDDPNPETVESGVPMQAVHISSPSPGQGLPLARARNTAAAVAVGQVLVFLDVDCIPAHDTFEAMLLALSGAPSLLVMAEPRYLGETLPRELQVNDEKLTELSVAQQSRSFLPRQQPTGHHEMFRSTAFALRRSDFTRVGGFDERYVGYGAEDTDFAFRARDAGLHMFFMTEPVFHQHHPVYRPPLDHFAAIVDNARRFFDCWGIWPMTESLAYFAQRELIEWDERGPILEVLRHPGPREIDASRVEAAY